MTKNQIVPRAKGQETKDKKFLLQEIQKYSNWGTEYKRKLECLLAEFLEKYPNDKAEAEAKIAFGKYLKECADRAYRLGSRGKPEAELTALQKEMEGKGAGRSQVAKVRESYQKGVAATKRYRDQKNAQRKAPPKGTDSLVSIPKVKVPPMTLTTPLSNTPSQEYSMDIHPNFPTNLSPAKSWTILIDETGQYFSEEIFSEKTNENDKGKIVAVLVPEGCNLPNLSLKWHAVNTTFSDIEKNIETLRKSPCGLLGITVESLNYVHGELWFSGIENLLDLILRFLPLEEKTKINLYVERRGDATPQNTVLLQKTCDDVLYRLSRAFPERAKKITISPRIIKKEEHPWDGYVDAAAFLWGSSAQKSLLCSTGWLNTCFLGTDAEQLRNALDVLEKFSHLTAEEWSTLVLSPDADSPHSLVSILLDRLGEEVRKNSQIWNTYLNHVQNHLYSKAIHLHLLSRQIDWLKKYQPEDCSMSPRLQLIWRTVQLAESNHLGKTDAFKKSNQEFQKLCNLLYYEDAPLVCLATLHIAVAFMDEFDFRQASKAVQFWNDIPVEVTGRQYHGQVLSTYGQLLAFMGKNEEAIGLFKRALGQFQKLSDKQLGISESLQTRAYLLITMMDDEQTSPTSLNKELEAYLGTSIKDAIGKFAVSNSSQDKYTHHIILRYLVLRGSDAHKKQYLSLRQDWRQSTGHPWELILFYRALLTEDVESRKALLRQAYELAMDSGGATLKVIACVILGSLYCDDQTYQTELQTLTAQVVTELPALGKSRIKVLQRQLESPLSPLELAKAVLPFNFR